jgi:ABC-type transport system substrate-binding protein
MGHSSILRKVALISGAICAAMIMTSCVGLGSVDEKVPHEIVVWSVSDATHDPIAATHNDEHFLTSLENDTLFGLQENGTLSKHLADRYKVSASGATVSVFLKDKTFSDGAKITAKDVKATLTRLARVGGDISEIINNIKGYGEAKSGQDFFGITTPSTSHIDFALINPDPFFVYHLAHPATAILPANTIDAAGALTFGAHSGPYTAKTINNENNGTTRYVPRDDSWPVVTVVRKSADDIKKAKNDSVDIVLGEVKNNSGFSSAPIHQLAVASWNLYVKDANSPLANIKLRHAILAALDDKASIKAYSQRATKPTSFVGDTFDSISCGTSCTSDLTTAKKLVKSIYPDATTIPAITIDIEDNDIQKALADSATSRLKTLGIKTTVRTHDPTELSNVIARGEAQLFRFGWVSDVAVGADPLVKSFKADSTENVSGLTDAGLEKKITTYLEATTFSSKVDASKDLQERVKDLWITRPIALFRDMFMINTSLKHVTFDYYGRSDISKLRTSGS